MAVFFFKDGQIERLSDEFIDEHISGKRQYIVNIYDNSIHYTPLNYGRLKGNLDTLLIFPIDESYQTSFYLYGEHFDKLDRVKIIIIEHFFWLSLQIVCVHGMFLSD